MIECYSTEIYYSIQFLRWAWPQFMPAIWEVLDRYAFNVIYNYINFWYWCILQFIYNYINFWYWIGLHTFIHAPNHADPANPMDELDSLRDNLINWCPYNNLLQRMPYVVYYNIGVWMARVQLIHFWIISHYYPNIVMRRFRFFQYIPPRAPLSWDIHLKLDNVDHTSKKVCTNWRSHWRVYVYEWADVDHRLVHIMDLYDIRFRSDYMQWYEGAGMRTVFF
jgi:hypothetical protein